MCIRDSDKTEWKCIDCSFTLCDENRKRPNEEDKEEEGASLDSETSLVSSASQHIYDMYILKRPCSVTASTTAMATPEQVTAIGAIIRKELSAHMSSITEVLSGFKASLDSCVTNVRSILINLSLRFQIFDNIRAKMRSL